MLQSMVDSLASMEVFPGFISLRFEKHSKNQKEIHIRLEEFLDYFEFYETAKYDNEYDILSVYISGVKILALREKNGSSSCENPSL